MAPGHSEATIPTMRSCWEALAEALAGDREGARVRGTAHDRLRDAEGGELRQAVPSGAALGFI